MKFLDKAIERNRGRWYKSEPFPAGREGTLTLRADGRAVLVTPNKSRLYLQPETGKCWDLLSDGRIRESNPTSAPDGFAARAAREVVHEYFVHHSAYPAVPEEFLVKRGGSEGSEVETRTPSLPRTPPTCTPPTCTPTMPAGLPIHAPAEVPSLPASLSRPQILEQALDGPRTVPTQAEPAAATRSAERQLPSLRSGGFSDRSDISLSGFLGDLTQDGPARSELGPPEPGPPRLRRSCYGSGGAGGMSNLSNLSIVSVGSLLRAVDASDQYTLQMPAVPAAPPGPPSLRVGGISTLSGFSDSVFEVLSNPGPISLVMPGSTDDPMGAAA